MQNNECVSIGSVIEIEKKKPYSKIFDLVQLINNGSSNTKVDCNYWSVDGELSVVVYPPAWVNTPECIKHLYITEASGKLVMLNQIRVIETYLQGVLDESN
ncbi:MAG: hypothetical protein Q4F05_11420 [bacterium]|nr:hypothetical protein [bacterium]